MFYVPLIGFPFYINYKVFSCAGNVGDTVGRSRVKLKPQTVLERKESKSGEFETILSTQVYPPESVISNLSSCHATICSIN